MAQKPKSGQSIINRKEVRLGLKLWPDSAALGETGLAQLEVVRRRQQTAGYADSIAGRGVALRQLIEEFVGQLKPDEEGTGEQPQFDQPRWRFYHILQQQFIHNRRAQDVREEMGVSESGYFNDQRKALDALVTIFKEGEIQVTSTAAPVTAGVVQPTAVKAPSNLPHPSTAFIGREGERARIAELLGQENCRLVSIIGPGGMGKTRLAIQSAADYEVKRTAYFIQLDTLESADLLVPTIAQALHFTIESQGEAQQQLLDFLRPKQWLLVLDNFEHLTREGVDVVAAILQHAPQIKLIVTSRERLNLRGEWVIDLRGLAVPDDVQTAAPENYSAVQLFMEALERVRAGQAVTAAEMADIVQICQLVRGMPLALELAASWGGVLSCADIAGEIQQSLDFLESAYRDLPARHQSLRAVFQHSWVLLTEKEQEAFQRLAVFRGGFGRTAARQVADAPLPLLHSLVSKSLLRVGESGRFSVHPLLRQFAREQLQADGTLWHMTKVRHVDFYAGFVAEQTALLRQGGEQKAALERVEQEAENIRLMWRWAVEQAQYETVLGAAEGIYHFLVMTNRVREGSQMVGQMIAHLQTLPWDELTLLQKRLMGMVLGVDARLHYMMGRDDAARAGFEEALLILCDHGTAAEQAFIRLLAIPSQIEREGFRPDELYQHCLAYYQKTDDRWAIATAHVRYVDYLRNTQTGDDHGIQRELMRQSLKIREAIGDQRGVANSLNYLCDLAYAEGDYEEAQKWAAKSLAIHQTLDNQIGRAHSLNHLGQVAGSLGAYEEARQAYQESLALLRNFGNSREVATALDCVGYVTYLMGEYDVAEPYYQESLQISQEIGDVHGEAWSLHNLGDIARAREAHQAAQKLYQESCKLHRENDPLSWGGVVALDKLGRVTLLMGEEEEAERHFREALRIALVTGRTREALDALLNLSHLFVLRGEEMQAAEMLQIIVHHSATAKETLDAAEKKLAVMGLPSEPAVMTLQEMSAKLLNGRPVEVVGRDFGD